MTKPITRWMVLGFLLVVLTGCTPSFIKGTKIKATSQNQAIFDTIMRYERTMSAGKWAKLINLVSPQFRETRGTPGNEKDDYGYDALREKLNNFATRNVRVLKFKVEVEKIEFEKPNVAKVYVLKQFAFLYPRGSKRRGFDTGSLPQMLVLQYEKGQWLFTRW